MHRLLTTWMLGIPLALLATTTAAQALPEEPALLHFVRDYATAAGLPDLRRVRPAPGATEIRVWTGFGVIAPDHSIVLKVSSGQPVEGRALNRFRYDAEDADFMRTLLNECHADPWRLHDRGICDARLARPADWAAVLRELERLGIATLPDESVLPAANHRVKDGASLVVEVATSEGYRAYAYSNPAFRNEPEARAAADIMRTANEVFR
ncbi:hypothetical protein [Pseudoxanthomonas sp. Root630]|uniref:hypothetical protein n=1 Tax=Pseudoxanthomonas sp. Root630 TaxID=1736574 RepID=UPI000703A5D6|nr:hypothetical protein [Pseudoxanthomonas sp. Root630]KRA40061.1 hypothetical protein ASD72_16635 [Pseudoxanthomonas sp. Root630]